MSQQLLTLSTVFAQEKLAGADPGHDFFHIQRVINNARLINEKENAHWLIIELAILLHDVGDRKIIKQENDDYSIARNFLLEHKLDSENVEAVMFIIENMSFSKTLNSKVTNVPKELYVVQDADRLDAIGAIGIARAFSFGGSRNRPMYDPSKKAQEINNSENYKKMESSTLHHFDEKLFLLKDLMNTDTAKHIATQRHAFMKLYVEEFLTEWNGEK